MPIRVLVVDDSLTVRKRIVDVLSADPDVTVVGEASDGKAGIELARSLRPDIITVDMLMPVMSGLALTEYVMAHFPTPILVVSASTNRGDLFKTYDALAAGAVDVLEKPGADDAGDLDDAWERKLVSTVKLVSRIRVITHLRGRLGLGGQAATLSPPPPKAAVGKPRGIVAIGASTGGPGALVTVLRNLPPNPVVPVFVVLHIDEPFARSFADWLEVQTPYRVSYAHDGEPVLGCGGRIVMPPPDRHILIRGGRVVVSNGSPLHSCRPSVDVLFQSLAHEQAGETVACLLTGMGRDGAQGLLEIKNAGGFTIAQDEATSVIYGMPREAALLGAADRILPLDQIGSALSALLDGERTR